MSRIFLNFALSVSGCAIVYMTIDDKGAALVTFVVMFFAYKIEDKIDDLKNNKP